MSEKLCGHATTNGPCTMPKGHAAQFHRHRSYSTIKWTIRKGSNFLEEGTGRVDLNYAISRLLPRYDVLNIRVEQVNSLNS